MSATRDDFCRELLDDDHGRGAIDPEGVAARFVSHFGVPGRPTMPVLKALLQEAGFGAVSGAHLDSMKGVHFGTRGGGYEIYYCQDMWDGAKEHTILHETYEIICETLCEQVTGTPLRRRVCRQADRFAAAVLMQPGTFSLMAEASGLDVLALQRAYRCSYASVTLRLAEVVSEFPLMTVLYERHRDDGPDPEGWTEPPELRATVVRRTRGFGTPHSELLRGSRGGVPLRGRRPTSGSLADRVAGSGRAEYDEDGALAAIARPVIWKGRLAKVAVVAVPYRHRAALDPQRPTPGFGNSIRGLAASAPW
ncbi:MAG: ImmA/IrrE family metallo-endopeptidase [Chloroflexi bacterium]|nr:ImmA/IrrE family metallo-endopeptidase [Chloroflexota bacterium]